MGEQPFGTATIRVRAFRERVWNIKPGD